MWASDVCPSKYGPRPSEYFTEYIVKLLKDLGLGRPESRERARGANLCHPKSIAVSLQIHKMSHLQRILLQTSVQMIVLTSTHLPLRSMRMLASRTCTLSSVRTRTVPIPEPTMPLAPTHYACHASSAMS